MLHEATVEKGTLDLIKKLSSDDKFKDFILVGGTGLSLQIGHRMSVDIDLFTQKPIDPVAVADHLKQEYKAEILRTRDHSVFSMINDVKVDTVTHDAELLKDPVVAENIRIASLDDIAAMKVNAIVESGARMRDFVDIHFLLEHRSMQDIIKAYTDKYPYASPEIAKRALLHYEDISKTTDVRYIGPRLGWNEIERRIKQAMGQPEKVILPQKRRRR